MVGTASVLSGCAGCAEDAKGRDESFTKRYPHEKKEGESLEEFKKRMHDEWWQRVLDYHKEKFFDPFIEEQSKYGDDSGGMDDYDQDDMIDQDDYIDGVLDEMDAEDDKVPPAGTEPDKDIDAGSSDQTDVDQDAGSDPRTQIMEKSDKMKDRSAQTLRGNIRDRAASIMKGPSPKCQKKAE